MEPPARGGLKTAKALIAQSRSRREQGGDSAAEPKAEPPSLSLRRGV